MSRNEDLRHLLAEDFSIEVSEGWLVVHRLPYLNSNKEIKEGVLYIHLRLSGNKTMTPSDHVAYWVGEWPCNIDGSKLQALVNDGRPQKHQLCHGQSSDYMFSLMLDSGNYHDYYEYVKCHYTYICAPAFNLNKAEANAIFYKPFVYKDENDVFKYMDTNSSRSNLSNLNDVFCDKRVAIIGLGGTGSYILDKVAKIPVKEIHLFDADYFETHNAFRAPGAPSIDDLEQRIFKVDYFSQIYSRMRKGIFPHSIRITESNLHLLDGMSSVFLAVDSISSRKLISDYLLNRGIPLIDSGLGLTLRDNNTISGIVRVMTATSQYRDHLDNLYCGEGIEDDLYGSNIQISELNSLAADLSVIQWKKLIGFYGQGDFRYTLVYDLDPGKILYNEDQGI